MRKSILLLVAGLSMAVPGSTFGFRPPQHQVYHPTVHAPVYHTPSFSVPHTVYHAPSISRPTFVPHAMRPTYTYHPQTAFRPQTTYRPSAPFTRSTIPNIRSSTAFPHPSGTIGNRVAGTNWANVNRYRSWVNRGIYINRGNNFYNPGYAHYYRWHSGWLHGYWHNWYHRPWLWFGEGLASDWLYEPGLNYTFWNPYYVAAPGVVTVFDYSQPIPIPEAEEVYGTDEYTQPPVESTDDNTAAAMDDFATARTAFKAGDYNRAEQMIDRAIELVPNDPTMHEFRALVLFAEQRYHDAAAVIYSVLAVSPGWDWQTMSDLYPDTDTYTIQLRTLEGFVAANPQDASAKFLLAYHYLVLNDTAAAARMLRSVVELQPKDELSAHLLTMLQPAPDSTRPVPKL